MHSIDDLLQSLQSRDSRERDKAALALMDIGDACAVPELLRAIARPENVNRRGTLVFALSAFDPTPHLEVLVGLALTGNAEVSTGALSILQDVHSAESLARMRAELDRHPAFEAPTDDELAARECLREWLGIA